jgi:hypothetical protein
MWGACGSSVGHDKGNVFDAWLAIFGRVRCILPASTLESPQGSFANRATLDAHTKVINLPIDLRLLAKNPHSPQNPDLWVKTCKRLFSIVDLRSHYFT